MPRPREFDEGQVLETVLKTFWARGYEGTSIDDLTEATGLARASLYGAFGDKARLFERAIAHYTERLAGLTTLVTESPSVRDGLRKLLDRWIEIACPTSGPRGCFLLLSAGQGSSESQFAMDLAARSNHELRKALEAAMRRGQQEGELSTGSDPGILAELFSVILRGLATSARIGESRPKLRRAAAAAMELLA
ncbi:MAG: TetR/AcrR family transcriptional regulator [Myxococcaceae bacterium]